MKKAKKPAQPAKPSVSPATSKTPFTADLDPDFLDRLRALTPEGRKAMGQIIQRVCDDFGAPHEHRGLGIRDLGNGFYECRKGLKTRLIFERIGQKALYFHAVGSHDEIRRFLKGHK
ncbi:MAG: hypothetical protein PHQ12_10410 [Chthoniobacteraceae bacterium]|nr:hypothetical protein [Chthoniobacteraceae bacterium]